MEDQKEITEEQKKEIIKVLRKAKWRLAGAAFKTMAALFLANLVCLFVGKVLLVDIDADAQIGFFFICFIINLFFTSRYLDGQFQQNNDIVSTSIKEILKK